MTAARTVGVLSCMLLSTYAGRVTAAPPWVDRPMTLPRLGLALDAGLGVAHVLQPSDAGQTGAGLNLEAAFGITRNLEIGLRTGARFGGDGEVTRADAYGRLFDTETYGTGTDAFANPEFHVRGRLAHLHVVEVGLEGRAYVPFEANTDFGAMFGVPVAFHFGGVVRLDTGVFVPVIFSQPAQASMSVPARIWFQPTPRFWLGPITAVRFHDVPPPYLRREDASLLVGFGVGYSFGRFADFKADLIFPRVNDDRAPTRDFGIGVGIGLNFD